MADVYTPVPWHNADIVARALTILGCNVAYAETQSNNPVGSSFASSTGWDLINNDTKRLTDLTSFKTAFCDNADSTAKCAFTTDCGGLPQMIGWMWPGVNKYRYGGLAKPATANVTIRNRIWQEENHSWGDWHIIPTNGVSNIASKIGGVTYFDSNFTIDDESILPGSLIFFQEGGALTHVGIYIGTIANLGRHLVIESTANKFGDTSSNSYIAGVGLTTVGNASTNFIAPYNVTGLDNTYKYGSRKWRNYSTSRENNCWVGIGRFINVLYEPLTITWTPDTNDATKGIFYVTARSKPSIVYPPDTVTSESSIFPLNPVTSHVNVKATLFNGNVEPIDTGVVPTSSDRYPEYDGTSGRYSYAWVKQNEGEATETTFAIGLSLKYDLRIGSDIPVPDDIPIQTTPIHYDDDPLDPPDDGMPNPSTQVVEEIHRFSKWYHTEDLNSAGVGASDLSYIDFYFKNHFASELKLYRISDGNRYNDNLSATIKDTTINIPGRDGNLLFSSNYEPRKFTINYAFDGLTDSDIRKIRRWLNKDDVGQLIFSESPSRAYNVKVINQPSFNFVPFDSYKAYGEQNIYRGDGKVEFIAYYPYAHTPTTYGDYLGRLEAPMNTWAQYNKIYGPPDVPHNVVAIAATNTHLIDEPIQSYGSIANSLSKNGLQWTAHKKLATVDMGELNWWKGTASGYTFFFSSLDGGKPAGEALLIYPVIAHRFNNITADNSSATYNAGDYADPARIAIRDDAKADWTNTQFKNAMRGIYITYELDTEEEEEIGQTFTFKSDLYAQHYACHSQGLPFLRSDYVYSDTNAENKVIYVRNYGDIGSPVIVEISPSDELVNITIYDDNAVSTDDVINQLLILPHTETLFWDSGTGLIYSYNLGQKIIHNSYCIKGNTIMTIPPREKSDYYAFVYSGCTISPNNIKLYFWYY